MVSFNDFLKTVWVDVEVVMRFQLESITASTVIPETKSIELDKRSEPQLVDVTVDLSAKHMDVINEDSAGGFSGQDRS